MDETKANRKSGRPKANRMVRDSAFTLLFKDPVHVLDLYRSLFPQDKTTTVKDIRVDTLELLWIRGFYNDLSFWVGNQLCVLTEAQSTWCPNMPARMLIYYTELLQKFLDKYEIKLTTTILRKLPTPKFFVIYTGDGHEDSEQQQLCTAVGTDSDVDVRVKILRQASNRSIIGQYIEFFRIYSKQQRKEWEKRPSKLRLKFR